MADIEVTEQDAKSLLATDREARDWLHKARRNDYMQFYDFEEQLRDVELVDNSADSIMKKAYLRPLTRNVTLMTYKINTFFTLRHLVQNLQKHRRVSAHDNILSYIGLTQDPALENYSIILDFATDNLRDFLQDDTNTLTWAKKLQLAKELTSGLFCLHSYDLYHGNLRSENIGMKDGRIKLHNFGQFKRIEENKKTLAQYFDSLPYLDPQHLKNPRKYFRDQIISDIYSLGVLLWEISSQRPPFENYVDEPCRLCYLIVYEDLRETTIKDTPQFYETLYQKCWVKERDLRPDTEEVLKCLMAEDSANFD